MYVCLYVSVLIFSSNIINAVCYSLTACSNFSPPIPPGILCFYCSGTMDVACILVGKHSDDLETDFVTEFEVMGWLR